MATKPRDETWQAAPSGGAWLRRAALRGAVCGTAVAVAVGAMAPAIAAVGMDERGLDVLGASPMSRGELDENRGGFSLGAFKINIGVKITTTLNNAVTLQSVLTYNTKTKIAEMTSNVSKAVAKIGDDDDDDASTSSNQAGAVSFSLPQFKLSSQSAQFEADDLDSDDDDDAVSPSVQGETAAPSNPPPVVVAELEEPVGAVVPSATEPSDTGNSGNASIGAQAIGEIVEVADAAPASPPSGPKINLDPIIDQVTQVVDAIIVEPPSLPALEDATQVVDALIIEPPVLPDAGGIVEELTPVVGTVEIESPSPPVIVPAAEPLVIDTESMAALAEIVSEAGAPGELEPAAQAQDPSGEQELALNDAEVLPEVLMTALSGGTKFTSGETEVTHLIQNGIMASIQNSANGMTIDQSVEMSVSISNFNSLIQGALSDMKANMMSTEVARFNSSLGN